MATVLKVEEEGIQIGALVMPHEAYYLLDDDRLVQLATEIGYCKACPGECAGYTWMEDIATQSIDEDFPDHTETLRKARQELHEWRQQLQQLLKDRVVPAHCLYCGGTCVTPLGLIFGGEGINPMTGKRYNIAPVMQACFLKFRPTFWSKEEIKISLPDERAMQLAKRVRGYRFK